VTEIANNLTLCEDIRHSLIIIVVFFSIEISFYTYPLFAKSNVWLAISPPTPAMVIPIAFFNRDVSIPLKKLSRRFLSSFF
jgi:hypothetical protein